MEQETKTLYLFCFVALTTAGGNWGEEGRS